MYKSVHFKESLNPIQLLQVLALKSSTWVLVDVDPWMCMEEHLVQKFSSLKGSFESFRVKSIRYSQRVFKEKDSPFFRAFAVSVNKITTECIKKPMLDLDKD